MKGHLYFIGIGGIGVSALARLYKARGWRVSGSDLSHSEITDALQKEGIRVSIGHRKYNLAPSVVKIVYTSAIRPNNPEIMEAKRRKIVALSYAQAVGELTRQFKTIAVAGAHGKSTTTAMIALMMTKAGLDPTVIIGTKLREFKNSNFCLGKSPYFVLEADEYRASFLNYSPAIAVITNLDREHLDFYKNIRNIEAAFLKFLLRLKPNGIAVLNGDDPHLRRIGTKLRKNRTDCRTVWFSLRHPQAKKIKRTLRIPGQHNISNALAAYAVGRALRLPEKKILAALADYRGSWRRFDYQGKFHGAKVFADYAHHPTEIKATLQAAREFIAKQAATPTSKTKPRIWCVFQPHHYERTRDLFREFTRAFDQCDAAVLLDIYEVAGRERKNKAGKVNSQKLAQAIAGHGQTSFYIQNPRRLKPFLSRHLRSGDILIMMGAGSIWEMTKRLVN